MDKLFSIGQAAKAAGTTTETLRHYDRIGLVTPGKKDPWTGYRYYTTEDIVRLHTVRALQQLDLPLQIIREALQYDDLEKIIALLSEAERKADEKIAAIVQSKSKIQSAKRAYESKLQGQESSERRMVKTFPQRVILLSDTLEAPTLDNLWNYLGHFYSKLPGALKDRFSFADMAGIYTENHCSRLFALCTRYADTAGLKILPAGNYLCADCTEETRAQKIDELLRIAEEEFSHSPAFTVQQIVISGILHWNYQVQVYIDSDE